MGPFPRNKRIKIGPGVNLSCATAPFSPVFEVKKRNYFFQETTQRDSIVV
jgi:hypothetical protein